MRMSVRLLILTVLMFAGIANVYAKSESIAVVVNDGVITQSDVDERLKLVMVSAGMPNTEKLRSQLLPQVINGLVDEKLKMQEAEKFEIKVTDGEIRDGFKQIAEQNKLSPEQFEAAMKQSGLSATTLKNQIRSQIAWSKVVQERLRPQVVISESDVAVWLDRLKSSKGKNEYLVSEIFLPVEGDADEAKTKQLAYSLMQDLRSGKASFFKVAQQVSQAAGASQGGDLGWIQEGQLPQELDESLKGLQGGELSNPVRSLTGYHLLLVRERRQVTEETMPQIQDVRNMIGYRRLDRLQERYLMDLKSSAFIENRLEQPS